MKGILQLDPLSFPPSIVTEKNKWGGKGKRTFVISFQPSLFVLLNIFWNSVKIKPSRRNVHIKIEFCGQPSDWTKLLVVWPFAMVTQKTIQNTKKCANKYTLWGAIGLKLLVVWPFPTVTQQNTKYWKNVQTNTVCGQPLIWSYWLFDLWPVVTLPPMQWTQPYWHWTAFNRESIDNNI